MRHMLLRAAIPTVLLLLTAVPGCTPEEKPLPEVEGVSVQLSLKTPENGQTDDAAIVSWDWSQDSRVEGYAIYRAEQGIGATETEKTEFALEAITIASQYIDDDIRTTLRYPTMRYFYQVAVIGPGGAQGPHSAEVVIEYSAAQ